MLLKIISRIKGYYRGSIIYNGRNPILSRDTIEFSKRGINVKQTGHEESEDFKNKTNTSTSQKNLYAKFSDSQATCENKTTLEVLRGLIVFQMCSFKFLVNNNVKILNIAKSVLGKTLFERLMKATFYGHFVAGEDDKTIVPILQHLQSFGVKTMLDYAAEEDISHDYAVNLELAATTTKPSEANEIDGELPQYKTSEKFADRRYKVSSARTYFYEDEQNCEKNFNHFKNSLCTMAKNTKCSGINAVKLTALGRPQILLQLSEVIMRVRSFVSEITGNGGNVLGQHLSAKQIEENLKAIGIPDTTKFLKNVVTDKDGVIHLFPWSGIINEDYELNETFRVPSKKQSRMVRLISKLSAEEVEMFHNMIRRLNGLINTAKDLGLQIVIDAEQTYFQPAISRITLEMMNKYNHDQAIVLNTYQCYLKESFHEVSSDLEQAKRQNFYFGAKLVRGAYIEQERERAAHLNYPDPIHPTFEATTEMYHRTLSMCLRHIKCCKDRDQPKRVSIMAATHNEDSVRFTIEQMEELGISPEEGVVSFGQLYGMCDFLTFPLGQSGYSAYKYVPYGPIDKVLPYLSRRALENKSVFEKLSKEKRLLRKELMRRLIKRELFYKPVGKYDVVC